ncbi:hypothetical protein FB45DRAFT_1005328, partial [Roridomyces roridus]
MTTLHPALQTQNISRLPGSLQPFARKVMNLRSWAAIPERQRSQLDALKNEENLGLLPVIYANLDPSLIPFLDDIGTLSVSDPRIQNAMSTLRILRNVAAGPVFPRAASLDIWHRVWPWVEFLVWYADCALSSWEATPIFRPLAVISRVLAADPSTNLVITSTIDIIHVFATVWTSLMQAFSPSIEIGIQLESISAALYALTRATHRSSLSELLDACGGSPKTLLLALKQHISLAAAHPRSSHAQYMINSAAVLVSYLGTVSRETVRYLQSNGLIATFVSAMNIGDAVGLGSPARPSALPSVIQLMYPPPGYSWVIRALEAGLLEHIITWGERMGPTPVSEGVFVELFDKFLFRHLVYYPVIVTMKKLFARLESAARSEKFTRSGLYPRWHALKALVDARAVILEAWDAGGRPSFLPCHNLRCDQVGERHGFRRCSVCHNVVYCSRACQRNDWRDGHRSECQLFQAIQETSAAARFNYRERSFIRALLQADYQRLRISISMATVDFMAKKLNTPFCISFDYTSGAPVAADILPISSLKDSEPVAPHVGRIDRAGGRLVLHLLRIGRGGPNMIVVWPLRATTSEFQDGLKHIATQVAAGLDNSAAEALV